MEAIPASPFDEDKWGALRSAPMTVKRIRERARDQLELFRMVFKDTKSGLEFLAQDEPVSVGLVKSAFGEAQLRLSWLFLPKAASAVHEELVGRIVALVPDHLDLATSSRSLAPIWELIVPEHGDVTVRVSGQTSVISESGFQSRVAEQVFRAGMALNRAIAEATS